MICEKVVSKFKFSINPIGFKTIYANCNCCSKCLKKIRRRVIAATELLPNTASPQIETWLVAHARTQEDEGAIALSQVTDFSPREHRPFRGRDEWMRMRAAV